MKLHVHHYVPGPSGSVKVCACGAFKFTEAALAAGPVIVGVWDPVAKFYATLDVLRSDATPVPDKVALMNELHPKLSAVFDKVRPASHWKDPIDAVVTLDPLEAAMVDYAVEFFTATPATITGLGAGRYRVTAAGYRAGPAGDH